MTSMVQTPFPFALWLKPHQAQYALIHNLIGNLALRYGTQVFPPHVTLCSGMSREDLSTLGDRMDRLSSGLAKLSLRVRGFGGKDEYFHFLYLLLDDEEDSGIFQCAAQVFPGTHQPSVGPHLSLMYADSTSGIKTDELIADMAGQLPSRVMIEGLLLVVPSTGRWRDISSWRVHRLASLGE